MRGYGPFLLLALVVTSLHVPVAQGATPGVCGVRSCSAGLAGLSVQARALAAGQVRHPAGVLRLQGGGEDSDGGYDGGRDRGGEGGTNRMARDEPSLEGLAARFVGEAPMGQDAPPPPPPALSGGGGADSFRDRPHSNPSQQFNADDFVPDVRSSAGGALGADDRGGAARGGYEWGDDYRRAPAAGFDHQGGSRDRAGGRGDGFGRREEEGGGQMRSREAYGRSSRDEPTGGRGEPAGGRGERDEWRDEDRFGGGERFGGGARGGSHDGARGR
ncbi:hypothetical protein T484DRAFT_1889945, partial [Baffinella frigidus]